MPNNQMITLTLTSEEDTKLLAKALASMNITGSVWLSGDLGAGKTTLTRYWLHEMGHTGKVKSPTYTLVEPYQVMSDDGQKMVYHADLYRLQDPEELSFIGFNEYLEDETALCIIEWASRALDYLPEADMCIEIQNIDDVRHVTVNIAKHAKIDASALSKSKLLEQLK